jgi:uncharacterized membrane protein (UPF0136 family)
MDISSIAINGILVLALLVFAGGMVGFLKAKSKISGIAGCVSALLLCACFYVTTSNQFAGIIGAAIVAAILEVVFVIRLVKTQKFMPAGMILILCIIEQLLLAVALFSGTNH